MMKPSGPVLLTALALGCRDESACGAADYSVCGSPLSATQGDGQPWPTFSQALAQTCPPGSGVSSWDQVLRGMCADGKQFISTNGGLGGGTRYFRGELLVGIAGYSDTPLNEGCECLFERFQGTLESVRCDAPTFEALCGTSRPMTFEAPFAQGTAFCQCDDPR